MISAKEYRKALEQFELTQGKAGWLFGSTERTGRRWCERGAPYSVALVIALMRELKLTPDYVAKIGAPFRRKK